MPQVPWHVITMQEQHAMCDQLPSRQMCCLIPLTTYIPIVLQRPMYSVQCSSSNIQQSSITYNVQLQAQCM